MENKMNMEELRKRGFIYCPICGQTVYPEIEGGTDDTMNGMWTDWNGCKSSFTFFLEEKLNV